MDRTLVLTIQEKLMLACPPRTRCQSAQLVGMTGILDITARMVTGMAVIMSMVIDGTHMFVTIGHIIRGTLQAITGGDAACLRHSNH